MLIHEMSSVFNECLRCESCNFNVVVSLYHMTILVPGTCASKTFDTYDLVNLFTEKPLFMLIYLQYLYFILIRHGSKKLHALGSFCMI